jgi:hypothetical protein
MPVSFVMVWIETPNTNMEETGILENAALLGLVLPHFEPGRNALSNGRIAKTLQKL